MKSVESLCEEIRSELNDSQCDQEHIDAICDCLSLIESANSSSEDEIDSLKETVSQLEDDVDELETQLSTSIQIEINPIDDISFVDTMTGQIQYCSDNLIDEELLETFSGLLQIIPPQTLLERLHNIQNKQAA